jgi:HK97 family phage portal protein
MQLFGLTITRRKAAPPALPLRFFSTRSGGWFPIVREPFTGAWQQNQEIRWDAALSYFAVFACVTQIAADAGKLRLRLVEQDDEGIWTETTNPAFSPVLRRPNRYQTIVKFIEQWMTSKLLHGNTYALKERDARGVVRALYVLDPQRVIPLVASDGAVYYELRRDDLASQPEEQVIVPASEIIHDTMIALFHPLIGVSPIYACGLAALQGLNIQSNSEQFFANGANPSGMLTSPNPISDATLARLQATLQAKKAGESLIGGDGLKYEQFTMSAVDAQLIEQLKWTAETICSCFKIPPALIGIGPYPPYGHPEALVQQYWSQCLQSLLISCETALDEGLGLGPTFGNRYGTEFDPDDLIWLDTATRSKAAADGIGSGALAPNEARKKYYGLGPVSGGNSPMVQQQYYSLDALAQRDADKPFAKPTPATPPGPPPVPDEDEDDEAMAFEVTLRKALEAYDAA